MDSMTAETYAHGITPAVEQTFVMETLASHSGATGAALWLAGPACSARRAQSAQAACTDTAAFTGGVSGTGTGSLAVVADDKPNFRPGTLPRDRQPV